MENNKILYKSFTKLALKVVKSKGMTLKEAKEIVIQKFERHPFEKMIIGLIDGRKLIKKDVNTLLEDCISVCEDFGPDRDYVTLIIVLERINAIKASEKGTDEIASEILKCAIFFLIDDHYFHNLIFDIYLDCNCRVCLLIAIDQM